MRPLTFVPGQIFQGRVLKIYPNNVATLSIQGRNVTAHLETALVAGERYWFEVQSRSAIPRLKVLNDRSANAEQLRASLGIATTKISSIVLERLIARQIPFTRRTLVDGISLLERLQAFDVKSINLLIEMIERGLPLKREVFQALKSVYDEPSLSAVLHRLFEQLNEHRHRLTNELHTYLSKMFQREEGRALMTIERLLQTLIDSPEHSENSQTAKKLLARLGLVDEKWSKTDVLATLEKRGIFSPTQNIHLELGDSLQEALIRLRALRQAPFPPFERNVLLNDDVPTAQQIRTLLQSLGYSYEHDVIRALEGEVPRERVVSELKALLLEARQLDLPAHLKQIVEKTLLRLTGQQLLSQNDANFQQFTVQIPLVFGTYQTEVTIRWEGKKKRDGGIDPDFCRILFYLTLERLDEIVVDVQIQNRIMNVTVYSEREKPEPLIARYLPILKQELSKKDYQLLSLKWEKIKRFDEEKQKTYAPIRYEGVDIRI